MCNSCSAAGHGAILQGDTALLNKYKQSHLESYMEDNQRVAFCPSVPWCGRAIEVRRQCRPAMGALWWHVLLRAVAQGVA
jgi:hypothetical protein